MGINNDKPNRWKEDIAASVDFYNDWFMRFAPSVFRESRIVTSKTVRKAFRDTGNLIDITPELLKTQPSVLPILRMATCPPIARDRLMGLAHVSRNLVEKMEDADDPRLPPRMNKNRLNAELARISDIISRLLDRDILVWVGQDKTPAPVDLARASTIIADRLCGAVSNPIIKNAQEKRQLATIAEWLGKRGYRKVSRVAFDKMKPGTFAFRVDVPTGDRGSVKVKVPVDVLIMPKTAKRGDLPLFIEAKSAGDFANVNKRRKEEAQKISRLHATYGDAVRYVLFLCGYFDGGYLGYEATEGIDWVWEHRKDDLALLGI